jgi:small subunit ribosomal protein S13
MAEKSAEKTAEKSAGKDGKAAGKPLEKTAARPAEKSGTSMQQIIRLGETNVDSNKPISVAIRNIRGVSFMFSNAVVKVYGSDKKLNELSESELNRLEDIIIHPEKHNIPSWLCNRRKDPQLGVDRHLIASQLDLAHKMDINEMKKMKSYKGVRHILGQPVRGQRTRSSFRTGGTVGVKRQKQMPAKGKSKEKG